MADIVLGTGERIFKAVMAIKKAVRRVRQNKKECQEIDRCVADVYALLLCLPKEMMKNPAMRGPYKNLADSLEEALELIVQCQEKNALLRLLAAGDMAEQLRRVAQEIHRKLMVVILATTMQNLHITTNIQNLLITITLTKTEIGGAHPLLTQAQVHTVASAASGTLPVGRHQVVLSDGAYNSCETRVASNPRDYVPRR